MHKYIFWYRTILLLEKRGFLRSPISISTSFWKERDVPTSSSVLGTEKLLEEGVFTQPYSIYYSFFFFLHYESTVGTEVLHYDNKKQRGKGQHRANFLSIRCFCLKEVFFFVFFSALLFIGTSLVSYNVSAWRGGFYTALFHLLRYYIMVKKEWTNPNSYYILVTILHYFYHWFTAVLVISRF